MAKPNILVIMTDQHRFDRLSCMGDPVLQTPNIDALEALKGMKTLNTGGGGNTR